MTGRIGGMDRADCPTCGKDAGIRADGTMAPHGPLSAPCPGGRPVAKPTTASLLADRAAGRLPAGSSVDDRIRNGVAVWERARYKVRVERRTAALAEADARELEENR